MLFNLGHVVSDVIEQLHAKTFPGATEDAGKNLTALPQEQLAIAEGIVGCRPHCPEVVPALVAIDRRADQLAVGQVDAVLRWCLPQAAQGIVADLVAEPARTRMNQQADLPGGEAKAGRRCWIFHPIDDLDLPPCRTGRSRGR